MGHLKRGGRLRALSLITHKKSKFRQFGISKGEGGCGICKLDLDTHKTQEIYTRSKILVALGVGI